jgi:FAD:protein FMN transferase
MNRRRFLRGAGAIILAAPAVRAAAGEPTGSGPVLVEKYFETMGAIASISVYARDRRTGEAAVAAATAEFRAVQRSMSSHDASSALNQVNRSAGREWIAAPPDVVSAILTARLYHESTAGAFDPTVGPLLELYGFFDGRERGPAPTDREITDRLDGVGFVNVVTDPGGSRVRLAHPRTRIDLGGIGVGIALDRAAAALRARGVEAALINHSGDIAAIGAPPDSDGWTIGVQDPFDSRGTVGAYTLRDRCVSTSGNYENFIETDRGRIGHILDPLTGRNPSGRASVTVFADSAVAADAFSTGFFAGGVKMAVPPPPEAGLVSALTVSGGDGRISTEFFSDVRA